MGVLTKISYGAIPLVAFIIYQILFAKTNHSIKLEDGTIQGYDTMRFVPWEDWTETHFYQPDTTLKKWIQYAVLGFVHRFIIPHFEVKFYNARNFESDYNTTGFTLVESPTEELDFSRKANRQTFYDGMTPIIRELHPEAEHVLWFDDGVVLRDADGDNPPAWDTPHLDFYFDQTSACCNFTTSVDVTKRYDLILGIWKPIAMRNPVVDYPLTVMDASTLDEERVVKVKTYINQQTPDEQNGGMTKTYDRKKRFLTGAIKFSDKQKWFYYDRQTQEEVLIFRHWTNSEPFANPHGSFAVPNPPSGMQGRKSIELRAGIILKPEFRNPNVDISWLDE